jgi:hypothetical protein
MQSETSYLGHFALANGRLPAVGRGGGARVMSLSSSAHRRCDLNREYPKN